MSKENLRNDLERLRSEVNQLSSSQPETRQRLDTLITDLENRIDTEIDNDDGNLMEDIRDYISKFETEHPRATAILNDIMVTLSNMGI
jgi:chemotaxis regulatin CheY-phosphate phosphatase CheZ